MVPWAPQVHTTNSISIGSAALAQLTLMFNRQTTRHIDAINFLINDRLLQK